MSSTDQAIAFRAMLAALDTTGTDPELIDEITALEQLTTAISARQARLTDAFATRHRAHLIENGMTSADARRSVCAQIALARRDSPHKGNRHVGLARTLVHELPQILQVMERGEGSEWRATLIARETAHLSPDNRARIDAAIAPTCPGGATGTPRSRPAAGPTASSRTAPPTAPARPSPTGGSPSAPPPTA